MGRGSSKAGANRTGANTTPTTGARVQPLPDNIGGRIERYYDAFISDEARGSNDVRYSDSGEIHEDNALVYAIDGSWETIVMGDDGSLVRDRQTGEITAQSGRLYGVSRLPNGNYNVTDIRTGTRISPSNGDTSKYNAHTTILTFNDGVSRNADVIRAAEERFNGVRRRRNS